MPLTDAKIRALKPADTLYRVSDSNGLSIEVTPKGDRYWRFRYRFNGKAQMMGLGRYPSVSLKKARSKRDHYRELLDEGLNPSLERQTRQQELAQLEQSSFGSIATEFLRKRETEGAAPATLKKLRTLLRLLLPDLAPLPIQEITAPQLLQVLRATESRGKHVVATEARALAGRIFRYAIATGRCEQDPSYMLREALVTPRVKGYAAIREPEAFGALLARIETYEGDTLIKNGLLLLAHTFVRPGQLRLAQWEDFDLEAALWRAPADRTKMSRFHIKPLSSQVVCLIKEMHRNKADDTLVMGSRVKPGHPISDMTFNKALRSLGVMGDVHVAHGFRKSASTMLNEQEYNYDWIERQLDHVSQNRIRGIYNAAQYLQGRTRMMQEWSDYLDRLKDDGTRANHLVPAAE